MKNCCQECNENYGGESSCYDNNTSACEKGRTFRIEFKTEKEIVCRIKVDACVITSQVVEKCDYVFVRCTNKDHYFVELKGGDIKKAYGQIITTITTHILCHKDKRYGFIICSKVPKGGTNVQKIKEEFIKQYGQKLEVKQNEFTHVVE